MIYKKIVMLLSVLFCSVALQVHSTPNKVKLVDKDGSSKIVPFEQKTMKIVYKEKDSAFSTAILIAVADTQKILS